MATSKKISALVIVSVVVGLLSTSGSSNCVAGEGDTIELEARLTSAKGARGVAMYKATKVRRKLNVEVRGSEPGMLLTVVAYRGTASQKIGWMTVDKYGRARLTLNTGKRQSVPILRDNDNLVIFAGSDKYLVGTLKRIAGK